MSENNNEEKGAVKRKKTRHSLNMFRLFEAAQEMYPYSISDDAVESMRFIPLSEAEERAVIADVQLYLEDLGITGKINGIKYIYKIIEKEAISGDVREAMLDTIEKIAAERNIAVVTVDSSITQAINRVMAENNLNENMADIFGMTVDFYYHGARDFLQTVARVYNIYFRNCKTLYVNYRNERLQIQQEEAQITEARILAYIKRKKEREQATKQAQELAKEQEHSKEPGQ